MKRQCFFTGLLAAGLALGVLFVGCENQMQPIEGDVTLKYPKAPAPSGVKIVSPFSSEEKESYGSRYPSGWYDSRGNYDPASENTSRAEQLKDDGYSYHSTDYYQDAVGVYTRVAVTWSAANMVGSYTLYIREEGKKSVIQLVDPYSTNRDKYDANGVASINDNTDAWYAKPSIQSREYRTIRSNLYSGVAKYLSEQFGVDIVPGSSTTPKVEGAISGKKYQIGVQSNGTVSDQNTVGSDIAWSGVFTMP